MSLFEAGFNLPPGVTGNEPYLTGEWPCRECGAILPEEFEGEPFEGDECPGGCAVFDEYEPERFEPWL